MNISTPENNTFTFFVSAISSYSQTISVYSKTFYILSMMSASFRGIFFPLYLKFNLILNLFAKKREYYEMIEDSESAQWPLQAGYPGLTIENLNDYVSLFSNCLVNIQNYQGIEIIGIKSPVCITRFDVANLEFCGRPSYNFLKKRLHLFLFGKIPPKSERNCTTDYDKILKYSDKSFSSRWYCKAEFDLFFPEPEEAPHIVYHSEQRSHILKRNLFDVSYEYTAITAYKDNWSKILLISIRSRECSCLNYLK